MKTEQIARMEAGCTIVTKVAFLNHARTYGLCYMGSTSSREQNHLVNTFRNIDKYIEKSGVDYRTRLMADRISVKGMHMVRHTHDGKESHLRIDGSHITILSYRGMYMVCASHNESMGYLLNIVLYAA